MTAVYVGCKMCSENLPTGLLLAALLGSVFEGGAFAINTVNENLIYRGLCSASGVCIRNSAIWTIMQSISGSFSWIVAMYVLMTQMKPRIIWMTAVSLGLVLGLLGAMLILAGGAEVSKLLFFAWFEPMVVMLVVAGCRLMSKDGAAGRFFTVAALGVMLVHYYQLSFVFIPEMRYSYSMILKNALNSIAYPLFMASVVSVARSQAVKDNIRKAQTSDARKVTNEIKNVYVFPEYWWGLSLPILLFAYGISFLCFYYITKPDMNKSPIVFMYHTYHPCVLLDYLPGTLFAQPFFTLCEICFQITAVFAFVRTICYGHLPSILHSAATTVWVLVFTSTFPLVFTFNPSATNAMLHSVPFIFHQSAIAFWVLSQMGIMMSVSDKILVGNRKYFAGYACVFAMAELGGMGWMISMLLNNYGYGERAGQGPAVNNNADIDNSDVKFDPVPFVLAVAQIFNCWAFSILSPFKFRPLGFDLRAHSFLDKEEYEPERISPDRIGRKFHMKVGGRSFLLAFVVCALLTSAMAMALNLAVQGPVVWTWGFRDHLRTLPGAAVGAVGWTVCVVLILVHVVCVGVFEYMKNSSPLGTLGVHLLGGVLVLTSLSAHASTIPFENDEYSWFLGMEAFQFALILWIAVSIKLSFNGADGQSPSTPNLALDTIFGLAAIAGTLVSLYLGFGTDGNPYADTAALLLVGVFCFTDARNMSVIMNHIHIATDKEVPKALQSESFFAVPCFTMDIHGVRKLLESKVDQTELT